MEAEGQCTDMGLVGWKGPNVGPAMHVSHAAVPRPTVAWPREPINPALE